MMVKLGLALTLGITMMEIWEMGGPLMWPLAACSVLSLAVIVERWLVLRSASIDTGLLRSRVMELLEMDDVQGALTLCESTPGPVSAILTAGLRKYYRMTQIDKSPEAVEAGVVKAMEDFSIHVVHTLEKNLSILATIGNVAPLLGMTGTVTGMIGAFDALAASGADATAVATGIKEALVTTAVGLVIAIPSVIAYNYFTTWTQEFVLQVEESATELVDFVTMRKQYAEQEA